MLTNILGGGKGMGCNKMLQLSVSIRVGNVTQDQDSMDWTHEQAMDDVRKVYADAETAPDCLMIIALWNADGNFDTRFWNVGMKASEMIALLEVMKNRLLRYMDNQGEEP